MGNSRETVSVCRTFVRLVLKGLVHCNLLNSSTQKRKQTKIHTKSVFHTLATTFYFQLNPIPHTINHIVN